LSPDVSPTGGESCGSILVRHRIFHCERITKAMMTVIAPIEPIIAAMLVSARDHISIR
jgi:hypothetical protein